MENYVSTDNAQSLLNDKGFREAEIPCLSCNVLLKCFYNLSKDLFTAYK